MRRFLETSGELGHDLLAVDWDATPLGDPDSWPYALRNSVRILLTSKFSMWMAWGPELTFLCNEAYRRDTLGKKYPWALGKPASEVWSEIWDDIEPRIQSVMETGEATWDESLQLFLERSGFVEESYHTFSYSPLVDDENVIRGMLCVVKEDTEQVIAARRMATLGALGTRSSDLNEAETIASACQHLAANPWSLPFTLTYLFEDDGSTARLAGTTGFTGPHPPAHPAAPETVDVHDPAVWPADQLIQGVPVVIDDLPARFESLPTGEWVDPPSKAVVVPLLQPGQPVPYGFLVVGANPYRPLDGNYLSFLRLIAGHIAGALTDARAFEFERQRAETLAELDRVKTDFFTNISHEFRTPLTLMLGPTEDALADEAERLPEGQRQRVEMVHRNGRRLLNLVNSLLDFSRLASGQVTSRFGPVDLARYTSDLVAMFASATERARLALTIDCEPLPQPVHVDPDQWAKIVLNLVSNALKYTFEGGVTVRLTEEDGQAVLSVSDTGTGIPEGELPHLFERFHRVHGARSRTFEGSGIGLAMVAELATLHGGTVEAESTLGAGSTFTVRLPVGTAHLPPDQVVAADESRTTAPEDVVQQAQGVVEETLRWMTEPDTEQAPVDAEAAAEAHGRVLVVEDNPDMRDYVAGLLTQDYVVATAVDGLEALDRVAEFRPDLILTDVMMPRLDGFGLLQRLHDDPTTTGIPVIMLSARAGDEGTVEGLEAGADDYLVKPFSARELKARIRVNMELDRNRRLRESLQRTGDLLDQAQRLAKVASWEVDLATDRVTASDELWRIFQRTQEDFDRHGFSGMVLDLVVPEDQHVIEEAFASAVPGSLLEYEVRITPAPGVERLVAVRGEVVDDEDGTPRRLRGSIQDITEQRKAEQAVATASAVHEAAAREHSIADELQRSLLPERSFDLEHLDVATYYRAGVEGTQVGGDWYDIIELGAGRTALVVGDVMGPGVSAAAGMGQLRSAVRAFAKLDLPPSEVLEYLDGIVQDLKGDQIVTCVYAVFDSTDQTLRYANAGHLPMLLIRPGVGSEKLGDAGPPLGAGFFGQLTETVQLEPGCTVAFYTDGLVERRERDIDDGIEALAEQLEMHAETEVAGMPEILVGSLLPEGPDDDIAILVARVNQEPFAAAVHHRLGQDEPAVANARRVVTENLQSWGVPGDTIDEAVLIASELVTNAFLHGRPPIDLRLRSSGNEITLEVQDRAPYRPRRRRARDDDENGRGLQIVSILADRWGSRATGTGKSVWCTLAFSPDSFDGSDGQSRSVGSDR